MSEEIFQLNLGEIPTAYDTQIAGIITQDNYEEKGEKPYNFTTQEIGKNYYTLFGKNFLWINPNKASSPLYEKMKLWMKKDALPTYPMVVDKINQLVWGLVEHPMIKPYNQKKYKSLENWASIMFVKYDEEQHKSIPLTGSGWRSLRHFFAPIEAQMESKETTHGKSLTEKEAKELDEQELEQRLQDPTLSDEDRKKDNFKRLKDIKRTSFLGLPELKNFTLFDFTNMAGSPAQGKSADVLDQELKDYTTDYGDPSPTMSGLGATSRKGKQSGFWTIYKDFNAQMKKKGKEGMHPMDWILHEIDPLDDTKLKRQEGVSDKDILKQAEKIMTQVKEANTIDGVFAESAFYNRRIAMRKWLQHHNVSLRRYKPDHVLSGAIVTTHGSYSKIALTPAQIKLGTDCLRNSAVVEPYKDKKFFGNNEIPRHKAETAYLMWLISTTTFGFRLREGLTITNKRIFENRATNNYKIKLLTPKGAWASQSEASLENKGTYDGVVFSQQAVDLIRKKLKEMKQGRFTILACDENGTPVGAVWKNKKYNAGERIPIIDGNTKYSKDGKHIVGTDDPQEVLFGFDGQFLKKEFLDTASKFATFRQEIKIRAEIIEREIYAPLRKCYAVMKVQNQHGVDMFEELDGNIFLKEDSTNYWKFHPVHSMRHVFAQDKLKRQEWNYGVVARFGHWATVDELKKSYGEIPDETFDQQFIDGETKVYLPDKGEYVPFDKLTKEEKELHGQDENYFLDKEIEIKKQLDEIYGIVQTIQDQLTDVEIAEKMKEYNKEGIEITFDEMNNFMLKNKLLAELPEEKAMEAYQKNKIKEIPDYDPNDETQRRLLPNSETKEADREDVDPDE